MTSQNPHHQPEPSPEDERAARMDGLRDALAELDQAVTAHSAAAFRYGCATGDDTGSEALAGDRGTYRAYVTAYFTVVRLVSELDR